MTKRESRKGLTTPAERRKQDKAILREFLNSPKQKQMHAETAEKYRPSLPWLLRFTPASLKKLARSDVDFPERFLFMSKRELGALGLDSKVLAEVEDYRARFRKKPVRVMGISI